MFKFIFLSLSCSLAHARALSVPAECQKLAWKAGHKRECVTGAAGAGAVGSQALGRALGMRQDTVVRWTAKQKRLWEKMKDLDAKQDWRGLAALENEARTVATQAPTDLACNIYNRLGCCYESMGQYGKAIELHEEHKKIAEEVGDRAGVGRACGNLCRCYAQDGKFDQALTYGNQRYQISRELQLRNEELKAAHDIGTVLRLALSADRRGHATEASPGQASDAGVCGAPHTPSSLSEGMICRAEEAERWLRIALEGGLPRTHLQLARLDFDTGREEEALAHLKLYLAWCVEGARGKCEGCGQVRGEDAQMLTCGGELSLLRHCCLHLCCACAQMLTCSCLTHSKAAA